VIELKLAGFRGYKEQLLSLLSNANDHGNKAQPFDRDKSWFRIETIAYKYFARKIVTQSVMSGADREA